MPLFLTPLNNAALAELYKSFVAGSQRHHKLGKDGNGILSMLDGNRVGVGLTRSTVRHLLPSLFLVKGASK